MVKVPTATNTVLTQPSPKERAMQTADPKLSNTKTQPLAETKLGRCPSPVNDRPVGTRFKLQSPRAPFVKGD
jgi:hypothetical protein